MENVDFDIKPEKLELVENIDEVLENIIRFNDELPDSKYLISRLSLYKQWYYSQQLDLFGPSKFIGYKNNTEESYKANTSREIWYVAAVETELVLKRWAIETEGEDFRELKEKLCLMLDEYGKKPKSNIKINLVR